MVPAQRSAVVIGSFLIGLLAIAGTARGAEAPLERVRSGPHVIPYVGVSSFQGSTGKDLNPGFRAGGLGGLHINEMFSVNGELTLDLLNFSGGGDHSGQELDLALSPFVHVPASNIELVFGPKVGAWFGANKTSVSAPGMTITTKESVRGWLIGLNA